MTRSDTLAEAAAHREAGRYAAAEALLAGLAPDSAVLSLLAQVLLAQGREAEARAAHLQAASLAPDAPAVLRNRARFLLRDDQPGAALVSAQAAWTVEPDQVESWLVLAQALAAAGRLVEALKACDTAVTRWPEVAETYAARAPQRLRGGDVGGAGSDVERALQLKPHLTPLWRLLATIRRQAGDLAGAAEALRQIAESRPHDPAPWVNLGEALRLAGDGAGAVQVLRKAVALKPDLAAAWQNLGVALHVQRDLDGAVEAYEKAIALGGEDADLLSNLGALENARRRPVEAEALLRRALAQNPGLIPARLNLAHLLRDSGRVQEAKANYAEAARAGSFDALLRSRLALSSIPASLAEIQAEREAFLEGLKGLPVDMPPPEDGLHCPAFHLAYHGLNDRALMEALARALRQAIPALSFEAPHVTNWAPPQGRRLRIGMLSDFFGAHTIGVLYRGLLGALDRSRFEVFVIHGPNRPQDEARLRLDASVEHAVVLPRGLAAQQACVANLGLDVLFYPDIGMSASTYHLAHARLAPVQAVSWGHPNTTGLPTMDYALSSDLIEPDGAELAYSEHLVRMPRLLSLMAEPRIDVGPGRAQLGLPHDAVLYGCPQSLFKLHPDFDAVLAEIVVGDPRACIVLIDGGEAAWNQALKRRWAQTCPSLEERCVFLPRMSPTEFRSMLPLLDVLLDPPHFGSGATFYEAMAAGVPIVTWEGTFARGRIVAAGYRQCDLPLDLVAKSLDGYAETALAWGRDPARIAAWRVQASQAARLNLFDDASVVAHFQAFVEAAVKAAGVGNRLPSGWRLGEEA